MNYDTTIEIWKQNLIKQKLRGARAEDIISANNIFTQTLSKLMR